MSETVGQHSVATFTSPVNGTSPIDANTVKGNDNTLRSAYVDHDADPGIHVQSSTLASRPVANSAGRKWMTQDSGVIRLFYDDGTNWYEVDYLRTTGGTISGNLSISGTLAVTGVATLTAQPILSSLTASQAVFTDASKGLVSNAITGTGNVVMSASPTLTGTIGAASMTLSGTLGVTGLLTFASLKGTGATTVTNILDEDNMASDSATALATQQSIKAYVDAQVGASDALSEVLAIGNTTGANDIIVSTGQKIRTPAVAAGDGTSAITIANTTGALTLASALADSNLATISTAGKVANSATTATALNTSSAIVARDSSGNFAAGTITATLSGAAPAGSLSGTTLASNVVSSSLTSVGTLTSGAIGSGFTAIPNSALANSSVTVNGTAIALGASGTVTAAAGTLTGTTLASNVVSSSLTSVGTLSSLSVSGNTGVGGVLSLTGAGGSGLPAANGVARFASSSTDGAWIIGQGSSTDLNILNKNGDGVISIPTGTKGVVMSGDLTVDTSTLKVDSTNNFVGIGTASPSVALDVSGATGVRARVVATAGGTSGLILSSAGNTAYAIKAGNADSSLRIDQDGTDRIILSSGGNLAVDTNTLYVDAANNRVGVGTASPSYRVHALHEGGGGDLFFADANGQSFGGYRIRAGASGQQWAFRGGNTTMALTDATAGADRMTIDGSGNLAVDGTTFNVDATNNRVGIGTASPASNLTVVSAGTALAAFTGAEYSQIRHSDGTRVLYTQVYNNLAVFGTETSTPLAFNTNNTERMRLDASGNLGLGVTPSAWATANGQKALQVTSLTALWTGANGAASLGFNAYESGVNAYTYSTTNPASLYQQGSGQHRWYNAASGTAGNAISFTQAMTLSAAGGLSVGNTTDPGAGNISANGDFRLISSYSRVADLDTGGGFAGGYNLYVDGTTVKHDSTGSIAGYHYTSGGVVAFFTGGSQAAGTAATERARITSGGVLVVGNGGSIDAGGAAAGDIAVSANAQKIGYIPSSSGNRGYFEPYDGSGFVNLVSTFSTGGIRFLTNSTERARITSGGDFLVNTTDSGETTGVGFKLVASATAPTLRTVINTATSTFTPITLYNTNATNNGYRFYVKADGGIANYQSSDVNLSDERVKTDIKPVGSYWDKLKAIEIVTFKYKDQSHDDDNIGVIAQQVEAVAPEFIDVDGFGETPEGEEPLKTVYTTDLYHASIKALQEAMARIESLEARLAALEN